MNKKRRNIRDNNDEIIKKIYKRSENVRIKKDDYEIGRASCRERVQISVVAVSLKKKNEEITSW